MGELNLLIFRILSFYITSLKTAVRLKHRTQVRSSLVLMVGRRMESQLTFFSK